MRVQDGGPGMQAGYGACVPAGRGIRLALAMIGESTQGVALG